MGNGVSTGKKVVRIIGVVLMVTAVAIVVLTLNGGSAQHGANMANLQKEKTSAQEALDASNNVQVASHEVVSAAVANAGTSGAKVADLQTSFQDSVPNVQTDPQPVRDTAEALKAYMAESEDKAHTPWMPELTQDYKWEFETGFDFASSPDGGKIPCVWLCRSTTDDRIFGYAFMDYDISTKLFSGFEMHITKLGSDYIAADEDSLEKQREAEERRAQQQQQQQEQSSSSASASSSSASSASDEIYIYHEGDAGQN